MAWIELHQTLWSHKKTLLLAAYLQIENIYAAVHMIHLWTWSLDNAQNGDLTDLPPVVIAGGAGWKGNPEEFVNAAIAAGFIDQDEDGSLQIHDWMDYAGKLVERRAADRERKRSSKGVPLEFHRNSHVTVPNPTVPNQNKDTPPIPPKGGDDGDGQSGNQTSSGESLTVIKTAGGAGQKPASHSTTLSERFAEFWAAYPKKVGKKAAEKAWLRLRPDADLHAKIVQAVEHAKRSIQWHRENGRYIPNPATWLNQGRWDDECVELPDNSGDPKAKAAASPYDDLW